MSKNRECGRKSQLYTARRGHPAIYVPICESRPHSYRGVAQAPPRRRSQTGRLGDVAAVAAARGGLSLGAFIDEDAAVHEHVLARIAYLLPGTQQSFAFETTGLGATP